MIAIVDYGMGNLRSVQKAFEKLGYEAMVTSEGSIVQDSAGVVLPGVGAFGEAVNNLARLGLLTVLKEVIVAEKPFLGICLGLQLLFSGSEEAGEIGGLDIIRGRVCRFKPGLKVPHMGWNQIHKRQDCPQLEGIPDGSFLYFVHSYYVEPNDESVVATTTDYEVEFVSSIWRKNLFACQFHPEKSQRMGLRIIQNFAEMVRRNEPASDNSSH